MANYSILKNYIIYCLEKMIDRYHVSPPFLDVGCGIGDVSQSLAIKGWQGKAIDISEPAIRQARETLSSFPKIQTEHKSVFDEKKIYHTILLLDVLEHFEDDTTVLEHISVLLSETGHVILCVPSNPKEWRWDDDYYGHYRRYTSETITKKLQQAGLTPCLMWDVTFPVFYIMRKLNTKIMTPPRDSIRKPLLRTLESTQRNAWDIPVISRLLSNDTVWWNYIYKWQFKNFKERIQHGHEMLVLAKKT
ncbi:class I SAM-dependent methyltransferase [bacterium]